MVDINLFIGDRIRFYRRSLNLSQWQVAAYIGLSRTALTNIEQGRQNINAEQLFRIAQCLKIGVSLLYPGQMESSVLPFDALESEGGDGCGAIGEQA